MLSVHVHIHVRPGLEEEFLAATLVNAHHSVQEPGISRFDVCRDPEDPRHFLLVEGYRTPEAPGQHKMTAHYAAWRDAVAPMMAEPRHSVKFEMLFPDGV